MESEITRNQSKGRFHCVNGHKESTSKQSIGLLGRFAVPLMGAGVSLQMSK